MDLLVVNAPNDDAGGTLDNEFVAHTATARQTAAGGGTALEGPLHPDRLPLGVVHYLHYEAPSVLATDLPAAAGLFERIVTLLAHHVLDRILVVRLPPRER